MRRAILTLALLGLASGAWAQETIRYEPNPFLVPSGRQLLIPDGTVAAPGLAFTDETGTGLYGGSSIINFGVSGVLRWSIETYNLYPSVTDNALLGLSSRLISTFYLSRGTQGAKSKTLTDAAAAAAVIRVPVATAGFQAGEVIWNAQSTDGTDHRTTKGRIQWAGVNKAGTLTCTVGVIGTDLTASSNANTLVCTWTNVVNTTNCDLSITCTDNTAGSQTMTANFRVDMPTTATLVFP